jgi:hypothetical protein
LLAQSGGSVVVRYLRCKSLQRLRDRLEGHPISTFRGRLVGRIIDMYTHVSSFDPWLPLLAQAIVNHTYYSEGILLYEAGKIKEIRILVERVTVINTSVFKVFGGSGGCVQYTVRGILDPRANENANRSLWQSIDKQCSSEFVFRLGNALGLGNGDLSRIFSDPPRRNRRALGPKSRGIPGPLRGKDGASLCGETNARGMVTEGR